MSLIRLLFLILAAQIHFAHATKISDCSFLLNLPQDNEVHVRLSEVGDYSGEKLRRKLEKDFEILNATPGIRGIEIQSRYGKYNRSDESQFYTASLTFSGTPALVVEVLSKLTSSAEFETLPFRSEDEIQRIDREGGIKNIDPKGGYLQ